MKVFLSLIIFSLFSCSNIVKNPMYQIKAENGTTDFINNKGDVVLETNFKNVDDFYCSRAVFKIITKDGDNNIVKCGVINTNGEIILKATYDDISAYSENIAKVTINDRVGYINLDGQVIIPPQYNDGKDFKEGYAAIQMGKLWGYLNVHGEQIITPQFIDAGNFSEGLADVYLNYKWGYINKKGNFEIKNKFYSCGEFKNGLAFVKENKNGLAGFINKKGDYVVSNQFIAARNFNEGLAPVYTRNGWGFILQDGKIKIKNQFVDLGFFNKGVCPVKVQNKWGFINTKGKVKNPQYQIMSNFDDYGISEVYIDGYRNYIKTDGSILYSNKLPRVGTYSFSNDFSWGKETGVVSIWKNKIGVYQLNLTYRTINKRNARLNKRVNYVSTEFNEKSNVINVVTRDGKVLNGFFYVKGDKLSLTFDRMTKLFDKE